MKLLLICAAVVLGFTLWCSTARTPVPPSAPPETVSVAIVNDAMRRQVHELALSPKVVATGIVLADVWNNERMMLYYEITDRQLDLMFKKYIARFGFKQVIFTPDSEPNEQHTADVMDVMNGKTVCTSFNKTILAQNMAELKTKISTACMYGMPFANARYRHYILVFLSEPLTFKENKNLDEEVRVLKQTMVF